MNLVGVVVGFVAQFLSPSLESTRDSTHSHTNELKYKFQMTHHLIWPADPHLDGWCPPSTAPAIGRRRSRLDPLWIHSFCDVCFCLPGWIYITFSTLRAQAGGITCISLTQRGRNSLPWRLRMSTEAHSARFYTQNYRRNEFYIYYYILGNNWIARNNAKVTVIALWFKLGALYVSSVYCFNWMHSISLINSTYTFALIET